jgi:ATP synthase F1 delta subunit
VFHADRWAAAFINAFDTTAAAELERLKTLMPALMTVSKELFGQFRAQRLEKILKEYTGAEFDKTIRYISLVVSKNRFTCINLIIAEIEKMLDERNGILDVIVESAAATDSAFEGMIKKMICEKTGARGINLKIKTVPALIAGYRLRVRGFYIDASLRGQLGKMSVDLADGNFAAIGHKFNTQEY